MIKDAVNEEYFEWMFVLVSDNLYSERISYGKLLMFLHDTEFRYTIARDGNRADDGENLRYRFAVEQGYEKDYFADYIDRPCSVLEMMIALSIRCEEGIMDDPRIGDRTRQWFWGMINNLGLGSMTDSRFDIRYAKDVIERFLDHDYEPDGKGGLFTIRNCEYDLREVEIWYQLCWYLDSLI